MVALGRPIEFHGRPRFCISLSLVLLIVLGFGAAHSTPPQTETPQKVTGGHEAVPSPSRPGTASLGDHFLENLGQVAGGVRFYASGNPSVAFLDDGVLFVLREPRASPSRFPDRRLDTAPPLDTTPARGAAYRVSFVGAKAVSPAGHGEVGFFTNFLFGSDSTKWITGVRSFDTLVFEGLYQGVDLVYTISGGSLKYEFHIAPGADPRQIVLAYEGLEEIVPLGRAMVLRTPLGDVRDSPPFSFQPDGGEVACDFEQRGPQAYGFSCQGWDPRQTLVIDPWLYASFLGGASGEEGFGVAVDARDYSYIVGTTTSSDFPATPGAFDRTLSSGTDVFVAKITPDGSALVYATYLGGTSIYAEEGASISVDGDGNAYFTGRTGSADFPTTPGAYDRTHNGGWDAFITKLDPNGSALVYSTFLGGSAENDYGVSLALEDTGSVFVTGFTESDDFPTTPGAFDRTYNTLYDAYVAKLDPAGLLVYSTYLGGADFDVGVSIAVDSGGNAVVTGWTGYTLGDFPVTTGAYDEVWNGYYDAFVTKLNTTGTGLLFSSFLGGGGEEFGHGIALGADDSVWVVGDTGSGSFPVTANAYQPTRDNFDDLYISHLTATGDGMMYSTFLGGNWTDSGSSIAIHPSGDVVVTGYTISATFPVTSDAPYPVHSSGAWDGIIARLTPAGGLVFSSYIVGSATEWGIDVAVGANGDVLVTGMTESADFATTPDAIDTSLGWYDALLIRTPAGTPPVLPPRELTTVWDGNVTVGLRWQPSAYPPPSMYLVFRAPTPMDFADLGFAGAYDAVAGTEVTWMDTEPLTFPEERYYLLRAVVFGLGSDISSTTNTAGVFAADLRNGTNAIARPLGYFPWVDYSGPELDTIAEYRTAFQADRLSYLDPSSGWLAVPGGGDSDRILETGQGYLVETSQAGRYVFTGLPGSMIRYDEYASGGFRPAGDARSLTAVASGDDVLLTFLQPAGIVPGVDFYEVWFSTTRAGLHYGSAQRLGGNLMAPTGPTATVTHANALLVGPELFYWVVPVSASLGPGASTYSVGVSALAFDGSRAFGLPLRSDVNLTAASLADTVSGALGVLFLEGDEWTPHFRAMPAGVFDTAIRLGIGYQMTVSSPTRFVIIGR